MQLTVQVVDGEPRVQDLMLAERLQFAQPSTIRKLIKRKEEPLSRRGEVFTAVVKTSDVGGRPGKEYWLTKWQAIKICMWSEAPNADAVQDEIADVFDAYTDGKLVPREQGLPSIAAFDKLFDEKLNPIHEKLDRTHKVLEGTDGKVVQLIYRMDDAIPRKDPSAKNKRIYLHTLAKCFGGCCPCGCRKKIVDERGNPLLDERGNPLLVYDHWYSRERNAVEACWPVYRECNEKLKDDDYRRSKHSRFVVFHEERKTVQHNVRHPSKPRKKRSPTSSSGGQINMKF